MERSLPDHVSYEPHGSGAVYPPRPRSFHRTDIIYAADLLPVDELDRLPFGIVQLDVDGRVLTYNATEARVARRVRVAQIGRNFFTDVAPCTQVQEFYGRFKDGMQRRSLDVAFTFVFPFASAPREVLIRLFYSRRTSSVWVMIAGGDGGPLVVPAD